MRFFRLYSDQLADFARHEIEGEPEADMELVETDQATEQSMFQIQLFKDLLADIPSITEGEFVNRVVEVIGSAGVD